MQVYMVENREAQITTCAGTRDVLKDERRRRRASESQSEIMFPFCKGVEEINAKKKNLGLGGRLGDGRLAHNSTSIEFPSQRTQGPETCCYVEWIHAPRHSLPPPSHSMQPFYAYPDKENRECR